MTTDKKPRGYFDFVLAMDCETTGLAMGADDASVGHQAVSWGMMVVDVNTFKVLDELYVEIKWNDVSKAARKADPTFGQKAYEIHGLSQDYLEKNGMSEEDAVVKIADMILKYWGPTTHIRTMGHNVHMFDLPFLRSMFRRHGIDLAFGNRHIDTSSIAIGTVGAYNSDDMFNIMGFETRKEHNALDDVRQTVDTFKTIKTLWKKKVKLGYE